MKAKKIFSILFCVAIVVFSVIFAFKQKPVPSQSTTPLYNKTVYIADVPVAAAIADTEEARVKGLSGSDPLKEGQGMLFIFDQPGQYAFWMKDMKYPLDIIWINADQEVVYLEKNLSPRTYPRSFGPTTPILYVLEVPAGFTDAHNVTVGATLRFE